MFDGKKKINKTL